MRRIALKWRHDSQTLPLVPEHRKLYEVVHLNQWFKTGRFPELSPPRNFNEKLAWCQLFDQSIEQVECTDKLRVRDYVRARCPDVQLVPLLAVADHWDELDLDALPKSFVVKTNHNSGGVLLVRDKGQLDVEHARRFIEQQLQNTYGVVFGECAYSVIERQIFVEAFINPDSLAPPPDYKIHCSGGEPRFIQYISDRGTSAKETLYTCDWQLLPYQLSQKLARNELGVERPANLTQMVEAARKLCQDFCYVRVDLYDWNGAVTFGELTFCPLAGCYTTGNLHEIADLLEFPLDRYRPPVFDWDNVARRWTLIAPAQSPR